MNIKLNVTILILFLFSFCQISGQSKTEDYLKLEKIRINKANSIEKDIDRYIQKNLNQTDFINEKSTFFKSKLIKDHSCSNDSIDSYLNNYKSLEFKKQSLRDLYFKNNQKSQSYFKATTTSNFQFISCINGGFETGNVANYTFNSMLASAIPIEHLEEGCDVINNQGPFMPSSTVDQYQDRASIITAGNEPFLSGLGININKVHSGNYSLKLNPNPIDATTLQIGNVTSVSRDFVIDGNSIDFSYLHFGYVVSNHTHIQPFFRYRIYSINSSGNITGVLKDHCISMDFLDCRYTHINDNRFGAFILAYTPSWVCERINTSEFIGQNVRLEFTVSDCEYRGHFSSVYIDDLCGTSCPPTWGEIELDDINMSCPTTPFNVCGNFQLPVNGVLSSISLNIVNQFGTIINTISNPTITGQNFCFTINPSSFGLNPTGTYSFEVTSNYNVSSCGQTLNNTAGSIVFSSSQNPTFSPINPICFGNTLNNLPTISNNGIIGTWSPQINNTATTTYTFTPNNSFCSNSVQMTIIVNPNVTPVFNPVNAICSGSTLNNLPIISNNGITGTWSPQINNTATTTYTFTPNNSSCANSVQMTIVVNPRVTPVFNPVNSICSGNTLNNLPTISNNGIIGTWSPQINNTTTTTYTFTPNNSSCANSVQMTIVVNPRITPVFPDFGVLCFGDSQFSLPTTSNNNISGTWNPPLNSNQTTTYTFTPNSDECGNIITKEVEVNEDFDFNFNEFCENNEFFIKIEPINNSLNIETSDFIWSVNNLNIVSGPILNLTNYLNSSINNQKLPITIKMIVTDANDCNKIKSIEINNVYCDIQKGISPNNDGLNDFFDLRLLNVRKLTIFNRYGLKVFSKDNYYNEWHGQTDNDKLLPDGTYYYLIEFNKEKTKTGWIYINNSK